MFHMKQGEFSSDMRSCAVASCGITKTRPLIFAADRMAGWDEAGDLAFQVIGDASCDNQVIDGEIKPGGGGRRQLDHVGPKRRFRGGEAPLEQGL
jgi:hypothetical protein